MVVASTVRAQRTDALVLSALPADAADRRLAFAVAILSALFFVALVPFAKTPLGVAPTFIPIYETALIVNDVITATLLFGLLRVVRTRGLVFLACGYVFTAVMALAHMLSFPGAFAATGLLGAGPQSTAYLFVFWHTGFPLFVIAYALTRERAVGSVAPTIAVAMLAAAGLVLLATAGESLLPPLLRTNEYASAFHVARHGQWLITAAALVVLWRKRSHSVLDLWILVALTAWVFEIGLVAIFNAGRYDLGFYAGRIYGLASSLFVLVVLLSEQVKGYASLLKAHEIALSESALRQNRDVLSLAMEGGRMGVWSRNLVTDEAWWSPELERIFGLAPGAFPRGREAFYEFVHPEDRAALRAASDRAIVRGDAYAIELRFRHASGEWRWLDLRGRAAHEDGKPVSLYGVGIDITDRKRAEEAALESEVRFRTMVDGMPQLAWMARTDGWIYWYNRRWYEYTGTTPAAMEGWGWQSVHDPATLPAVMQNWQRSIATGEPFDMVFPLRGADGRFRPFLTRVSPLRDSNGRVVHWFGTNTDITAQRDAEEALRAADRKKDEFIATLAHELRNPLAPIRSTVEILKRVDNLPDAVQWSRDILDRQSRHLTRLVDDLLEMSRITQGKLQVRKERVSLVRALHDALEAVRPAMQAAGQEMSVRLPDDALEADADPTRVTQIFLNLLSNAVKFTPRGGRIWVGAERKDAVALFWIRDTGAGIAPEHVDRVFEMFSQVSPALERNQGGLGIGLALSRGLVELHGGTIVARSAGVGKGAEFVVSLPLATPAAAAARPALERPNAAVTKKRVLVVDDNYDAAATLRRYLELAGHDVREAHDGVEGVQAALDFRPDVVVLDIGMPKMNGYDAAREIRRQADGSVPRLIALTGWGQETDRQRAADAGFDLHLTKPVDPSALELLLDA